MKFINNGNSFLVWLSSSTFAPGIKKQIKNQVYVYWRKKRHKFK